MLLLTKWTAKCNKLFVNILNKPEIGATASRVFGLVTSILCRFMFHWSMLYFQNLLKKQFIHVAGDSMIKNQCILNCKIYTRQIEFLNLHRCIRILSSKLMQESLVKVVIVHTLHNKYVPDTSGQQKSAPYTWARENCLLFIFNYTSKR